MLGSEPSWGVYETASGGHIWVGVSATPTDVSTGRLIDAGEGNAKALGRGASDTIYMAAGNDLAQGLAVRDVIYGQDGDHRLYGDGTDQAGHLLNRVLGEQHGDDLIDGGAGNDILLTCTVVAHHQGTGGNGLSTRAAIYQDWMKEDA